jgi:predicted O-methyltransferase YrrM
MSDIVDYPEIYFKRFIPSRDALLKKLEKEAQREEIPIVGPVVGELLFILARTAQAKRILELGTATGYSTIFLARACECFKGSVLTIENDGVMAARARMNIKKAGLEKTIEIRQAEALKEIIELDGIFDFVFIDIEKADYIRTLPHCERLLKKGGLLVADNVGFKDADDFNRAVSSGLHWRAVSVFAFWPLHSPENDGICIAMRT